MIQRALVAVMAVGLLGTGCVSISQVQTADTLGTGKFQFAVEPGLAGAAVISDSGNGDGGVYYPHVDLGLRYGITETVDLGVRFGSSLVELQAKVLLTSPEDPDKAVSLAPSVMGLLLGSGSDNVSYLNAALPVLVGFKSLNGSELVLGPRLALTRVSAGDVSANIISAGTSVGYALRVTNGFRLMPEVALSYPLVGSVSTASDSDVVSGFNGGFVQVKLGFLFGAGRPANSATETSAGPLAALW
jgi:hypothetical protein